jgi:hypothetical protein
MGSNDLTAAIEQALRDRAEREGLWNMHLYDVDLETMAEEVAALFVDTEWSCHPTPDGRRFMRFHDKNSAHMDGCQRLYILGATSDTTGSGMNPDAAQRALRPHDHPESAL